MNVAVLLVRVEAAGFRLAMADGGPQLVRVVPGAVLPDELLADLKADRSAVVAYLSREECRVCGRLVDDEDRPRLADPAHCDRGGAKGAADSDGEYHEGSERCPYKPNR